MATNYDATVIQAGTAGELWAGIAVPSAGARMTITSGEPDATENTNKIHLGMTREGSTFTIQPQYEEYMADEFASPVKTKMSGLVATISCELIQVADDDVLTKVLSGFGTSGSASGYEEHTLGIGTQAYTGLALMFPLEADSTKYGVFHLYQAFCESGLDGLQVGRKVMSGINTVWKGTDITTRAAADTLGNYWRQV